ncbi:MAG: CheW protein [Gemmatimonadetes bacterium]|nr:CheW protein [Gemmatimonadota bacterium]
MSADMELMERRTRALAQPLVETTRVAGDLVVHFTLGGEQLIIGARWLLGVSKLVSLSSLPGAEPPIRGVTVWRGDLLTVLDIRTVLGISTAALSDMTRVLVLGERRARFGLLVDTVGDCVGMSAQDILPAPAGSLAREYLLGMTAGAGLVLDGRRLLQLFD